MSGEVIHTAFRDSAPDIMESSVDSERSATWDAISENQEVQRDTYCVSGTLLEVSEAFPVLFPVALLGGSDLPLLWCLYATVWVHTGAIEMPPRSGTCAENKPEDAGWAAVEKDVLVGMHDAEGGILAEWVL